ncbi:LmbU family transcriptional regulator [Actinoalloteichus spitiensis]|uniref:LmbU family transcriptional regulator n=1 Tax=Actinoalloteichus spitiensis TaxID=252394 RepID=UPI001FDF42B8|nr:LmbU family transcriptional regulator [Actinoalloteichus spitiensis]
MTTVPDPERTATAAELTPQEPPQRKAHGWRTFLALDDHIGIDEWVRIGRRIFAVAESSSWWLGDWLLYGQVKYPDRYHRAIVETDLDYQTLRNYAWVAGKFPTHRRRAELSFQHHAEVAALPPEEQDRWLERAERHSWSRNQLRNRLRAARSVTRGSGKPSAVRIAVNADPTQRRAWEEAAARASSDLEKWIAAVLDQAAGRELTRGDANAAVALDSRTVG